MIILHNGESAATPQYKHGFPGSTATASLFRAGGYTRLFEAWKPTDYR